MRGSLEIAVLGCPLHCSDLPLEVKQVSTGKGLGVGCGKAMGAVLRS